MLVILLCASCLGSYGQTVQGDLRFESGRTLNVSMKVKSTVTQQAMNNAISFAADGAALFCYKVRKTDSSGTFLQYEGKKIKFNFNGMGQSHSFDSENSADLSGQFGEPIKKILAKKFDMIIDQNGTVVAINTESEAPIIADDRQAIVLNMIKDISGVIYPPQKGQGSFFKILPNNEVKVGETWADSSKNINGYDSNQYTLASVNDSTIVVEFKSQAFSISKAILMGNETTTTLKSNSTGKIILDKLSKILLEKITVTESGGSMEAMGITTPITSRTTVSILVNPE